MKKILLILLLILTSVAFSQTPVTMTNGGNDSNCDATFYDIGGTGNYPAPSSNGQTVVHTICNPGPGPIWAVFTQFNLWSNSCIWGASVDKLKIYNGPNTSSPLIGTYKGTDLNSVGSIIEGSSGCLTFEFIRENKGGLGCSSNPGGVGWAASITCTEPPTPETGDNCFEAVPFCSDQNYNFPNNYGGSNNAPSGPNYGCLYSQPNAIWYYLKIAQTGPVQLGLAQANTNGTPTDIDFAMWGPFTNIPSGCNQIMSGNLAPLQCSFSASATETIGIGMTGGYGTGQSTPPIAQAGEYYIVVMTNYNGSQGNISLSQTAGTGATDCSILVPCDIISVTATPTACDDQTNTFSVSGTVEFSDEPETGNLIIEDCNGNSVTISAPFTSPVSYTISNISPDSQTCEVTAYFSDEPLCKKISDSYTNPADCSCTPPSLIIDHINVCDTNGVDLNIGINTSSDPATLTFYNTQSDANGSINSINNIVNTSGTYWIRAESPNDANCYSTHQINVNATVLSYTSTVTDETCGSENGTITIVSNGGTNPITYSINNGSTSQTDGNFTNLSAGIYSILIIDDNGCEITGHDTIVNIPGSAVNFITFDETCPGSCDGKVEFTNIQNFTVILYSDTIKTANGKLEDLCANTYNLVVIDSMGCKSYSNFIIGSGPAIVANFSHYQVNDDENVIVNLTNESTGNYNEIFWNFGDGAYNFTDFYTTSHTYPTSDNTYVITLFVSDTNNYDCTDVARIYITITEPLIYYVPNTITPDGDEFNDVFLPIFYKGILDYHLTIYNRWGEILFESFDKTVGWNGTYDGKLVKDGTYIWKIEYRESGNKDKHSVIHGHVNLIR